MAAAKPKDPWKVEDDGKIGEGRERVLMHLGAVGAAADRELIGVKLKIVAGGAKKLMERVRTDVAVDRLHDVGGDVVVACRGALPTPSQVGVDDPKLFEAHVRQLVDGGWLREGTPNRKGKGVERVFSFWQGERLN